MANESNEKKAEGKVELSLDELEGAAGGYILYRPGGSAPYNVIDDETGDDRLNTSDINRARKRAAKLGLSDQEIDHDEYVQKFGHKFYY